MSSQQIELDLDMDNELVFKVSIEGTSPAPARTRFIVETKNFSLVFPANTIEKGEVSVSIPKLENVIKEGNYTSTLEVIVDDRVFIPIELDAKFSKSVTVVAEAVNRKRPTSVTASHVVSVNPSRSKPKQTRKSSVSESKNKRSKNSNVSVSRELIIERKIRALAAKRNVKLSESQVRLLVSKYNLSNRK